MNRGGSRAFVLWARTLFRVDVLGLVLFRVPNSDNVTVGCYVVSSSIIKNQYVTVPNYLFPFFPSRYNRRAHSDPAGYCLRRRSRAASPIRPVLFLHGLLRVHSVWLREGLSHRADCYSSYPHEGESSWTGAGVCGTAGLPVGLCGAAHGHTSAWYVSHKYFLERSGFVGE